MKNGCRILWPDCAKGINDNKYHTRSRVNDNKYLVENAVAGLAAGMSANLYNETTAPGINYNKIYAAMKAANKYSNFKIVLDGRELGRGLRGMGVQFSG